MENVANKVALMVGDRRRRVRQAALDTLAVLAQIYEPEVTSKEDYLFFSFTYFCKHHVLVIYLC